MRRARGTRASPLPGSQHHRVHSNETQLKHGVYCAHTPPLITPQRPCTACRVVRTLPPPLACHTHLTRPRELRGCPHIIIIPTSHLCHMDWGWAVRRGGAPGGAGLPHCNCSPTQHTPPPPTAPAYPKSPHYHAPHGGRCYRGPQPSGSGIEDTLHTYILIRHNAGDGMASSDDGLLLRVGLWDGQPDRPPTRRADAAD